MRSKYSNHEVAGGVVKKYYSAGGQRIAMRSGGTLSWLLADHLGGTAHTLSGATETGEVRYKAFGATRFTSGTTPTTYRFTGQREEVNLGLYYYNARWYDPALGHFLAPDSMVPAAGNALDYHRYARGPSIGASIPTTSSFAPSSPTQRRRRSSCAHICPPPSPNGWRGQP
jgi:RHS repeat-associated protein